MTTRTEHSIITILDALQKGMFDGSLDELLPLMLKEAEDISNDSPDKALERGYDFWGVSELAGKMGNKELKKNSLHVLKTIGQYGYRNLRTLVLLQI